MDMHKSSTVYHALTHAAGQWPQRPLLCVLENTAQVYGIEAEEISFAQMQLRADELSLKFEQAGYQTGQRVILLLENRPAFFYYWLALNKLGLSVVPVNSELRAAELEYIIDHAEPCLAISIPGHIAVLKQAANAAGRTLPVMEPGAQIPGCTLEKTVTNTDLTGTEQEAALLYTSGTTAKPKGCVLSNMYFLLAGEWYANAGGLCSLNTKHERMLTPLPLFHMNAMAYSFMAMVNIGGCLICLDRFHPASWWDSVRESKATCLHYLGVMPPILMNATATPTDREHTIRFGFGAGIDPALLTQFEERFGFPLVEAWAMTETGAGAVVANNHEPRLKGERCFGRVGADIDVDIVDDNGNSVAHGTVGELLVRRQGKKPKHGFFTEYFKNREATEEAWRGGWFHTGDIVKCDAGGNMIFIDRKKNVIRRSGENIAAVEVEAVLLQHPDIANAAVAAVDDATRGDEVFACIQTPKEPSPELAYAIASWCLERMAYFKVPGYIAFVESLPVTATQKVQRSELARLASTLLASGQATSTLKLKKRQST